MKYKTTLFSALIAVSVLFVGIASVSADAELLTKDYVNQGGAPAYVPGEVLVKFKNDSKPFHVLKLAKGSDVPGIAKMLEKNPNIEHAGPNYIAHATFVPNDPYYDIEQWNDVEQWNFDSGDATGGVHAEAAWEISKGVNTIVAVIDTGVAYENYTDIATEITAEKTYSIAPDLAGTCFTKDENGDVLGYDFVNDDAHPNDDHWHGTHVTGTIAQTTDNNLGTAGLAHESCIMPIKVLDANGSGNYDDIAAGIYFAVDNGADVINMSLGGPSDLWVLEEAVQYAFNNEVVVVAATGNDADSRSYERRGSIGYPAAYDEYVIAVGATDRNEDRASFSNYGSSIDIVAPGVSIVQQTFNPDTGVFAYYWSSGTSMATPHVAAAAAMVISNNKAENVLTTADTARAALQETAGDLGTDGWDKYYGHGLLNIEAALNWPEGTVVNKAPVADAGADQDPADIDGDGVEWVTLSGSGSYDPEGTVITYEWKEGEEVLGTGEILTLPLNVAVHEITLTVTDSSEEALTGTDTVTITVNPNEAPTADAGGPYDDVVMGESGTVTVTFYGNNSYDPDGTITSYEWKSIEGESLETDPTLMQTYTATGTYTVTLTVTDEADETSTDTVTIKVVDEDITVDTEMWVSDISFLPFYTKAIFTSAVVVVTVFDENGPVAGATVEGVWSGATTDTDSDTTNTNGQVTFTSDSVKKASSGTTYTFTVGDVSKVDWVYNSAHNVETTDSVDTP